MFRNKVVKTDHFAMIPRADIPRATFPVEMGHKTTFNAGLLVPVYVDDVLPGDTFSLRMTAFARMATPIFPVMDNLMLSSFFFFVPNRLLWTNWERFMGEQANPSDSISFVVPQVSLTGGYAIGSLQDYMGLGTVGQVTAAIWTHNALPLRAYNLIWNEWFRDQNLQNSVPVNTGDGPDAFGDYVLKRRGKRHDYFTSTLPWIQKFTPPPLAIGITAPVVTSATDGVTTSGNALRFRRNVDQAYPAANQAIVTGASGSAGQAAGVASTASLYPANLFADLSQTTGGTINALRQSFQIQRLLERDARGGTRYTEIIRSHFGVVSPDARLQRPEYLGGGVSPVNIAPIAQTSGSGASGTTAPLATLSAFGTVLSNNHGFTQSFTEHGYIIGLICVDAQLTYQQGLRKMWSRSTRYDFYFPVFAHLGEQPVYNREIYMDASANDALVFGYQERFAEYRYHPSRISGLFRSTAAGTLDAWHVAERFLTLPAMNSAFIESNPPMSRIMAVPSQPHFIFDSVFQIRMTRPMPLYSVPGLIDHF